MNRTIAFIPARGGSKSIPLKNIKLFNGKPLIYWNIYALSKVDLVDEIVLATDSDEISMIAESFNFSKLKVYKRNIENAQDSSSTESVMLEYINAHALRDSDTFMLVQATSPLTRSIHFKEGIEKFKLGKQDSILSCVLSKRFFWSQNGEAINYDNYRRPRRQDFEGMMMENGAFYINSVSQIKTNQNRLSGRIGIYEMPEYTAIELDEEIDWSIGEMLMQKYFPLENVAENRKIRLLLTDLDGVLTDGSMYYSENGDEIKRFHTYDGASMAYLKSQGCKVGIITGENRKLNKNRADKLKVDYLFQDIKDKLPIVRQVCKEIGISLDEVAYVGDAHNDLNVLNSVGLPVCPSNAYDFIKNVPGILKLTTKGGNGVLRELVDHLIRNNRI